MTFNFTKEQIAKCAPRNKNAAELYEALAQVLPKYDINTPERWDQSWMSVVLNARPYLVARAIAWALITWSNVWFLIHLALMVAGLGRRSATPTLLPSHHDETDSALPHGANA
jgi:hypothetical protein